MLLTLPYHLQEVFSCQLVTLAGAFEHGIGEISFCLVQAQYFLLDGMLGDEVVYGDVLSLAYAVGTVSWHISSLDPMTVEPTEEPTSGVLPVNIDGNGIGELSFDIQLKPDLPHCRRDSRHQHH